jgi:hypothetical protein
MGGIIPSEACHVTRHLVFCSLGNVRRDHPWLANLRYCRTVRSRLSWRPLPLRPRTAKSSSSSMARPSFSALTASRISTRSIPARTITRCSFKPSTSSRWIRRRLTPPALIDARGQPRQAVASANGWHLPRVIPPCPPHGPGVISIEAKQSPPIAPAARRIGSRSRTGNTRRWGW